MIDTLVYFTNKKTLADNLNVTDKESNTFTNSIKDEFGLIHYQNENLNLFFVYDQIDFKHFKQIVWPKILGISRQNIAVIHHNLPKENSKILIFLSKNATYLKKGTHQKLGDGFKYYHPIKSLMKNQEFNVNQFDAILEEFEANHQLEKVLDQLHNIWHNIDFDSVDYELKIEQ